MPSFKVLAAAIVMAGIGCGGAAANPALESRFDALINPAEMDGWMKTMAAEPNHVGAPHNKANAELTLAQFREWGWDAKIETFDVLYPTPLEVGLELLGEAPFKATLTERPVPGDASSAHTAGQLPAYVAFQGDGDVTAPLVYLNYGMPADYEALERMGVDVKGKIVIARYGSGWRGLKPQLAQEHGAVGCIIYSDPRDDGYAVNGTYPDGPARPEQGFQRGSVAMMPTYPGDPLTPGVGATRTAKRLKRENAPTILKIPVLPVSYGDATHFLAALGGRVAPPQWQGGLGITYRVGGTEDARAHLKVASEWSLKTIHNVVATLQGAQYPDQWVLRGNHRDGWVFGASDPLSGHIVMMAEAKAIGALAKTGWKPARTLVYLSWDAEEPMLLGSTEWAETHAKELQQKAVAYVNTDGNGRGFLEVAGSHSLQSFVRSVARDVKDPQTGVSVDERARAAALASSDPSPRARQLAKAASDGKDLPLDPLGSGSDFSSFVHHLGIASLNVSFGGEGDSGGVYHSAYDTWEHHSRFVDPGFAYAGALAKTTGRMVLRLADEALPVMRYTPVADTVAEYIDELQKLADTKREAQQQQAKALAAGAYRLADDPTLSRGDPTPLKPVPYFSFAPLQNALQRLKTSAATYDAALAEKGATLPASTRAELVELAARNEQALLQEPGLPGGRGWYLNMLYAPGRLTGYGAKTLPGVREAIEDERWADVEMYTALSARALEMYTEGLEEGVRVMGR